jgi:hypothetical protein
MNLRYSEWFIASGSTLTHRSSHLAQPRLNDGTKIIDIEVVNMRSIAHLQILSNHKYITC